MPSSDNLHYFRARASEERQRAMAATDERTGKAHSELARRYAAEARKIEGERHVQSSKEALSRSYRLLSETFSVARN